MSQIVAIIPARMASTRYPGKPLADILGLPMIEHVRRRVSLSPLVDKTVVATCDKEIRDVVVGCGGEVIMTATSHERCTDRIAEAMKSVKADIIVNVQGDEPLIVPEMIDALIAPFSKREDLLCTNLMSPIGNDREFDSQDVVKVVVDRDGHALYFSREPVPSRKKSGGMTFKRYKQLGIIAFRYDFLDLFRRLEPTPLEKVESVDMLRAVEHGYKVYMVPVDSPMVGVDTPSDLKRAEGLLKKDRFVKLYSGRKMVS